MRTSPPILEDNSSIPDKLPDDGSTNLVGGDGLPEFVPRVEPKRGKGRPRVECPNCTDDKTCDDRKCIERYKKRRTRNRRAKKPRLSNDGVEITDHPPMSMPMEKASRAPYRKAFVMAVNEGQEEEYERRHNEIWSELVDCLKVHGVSNYSIFIHPGTNQLFAYVELESEELWKEISNTPVCQKWYEFMQGIMPCNPDNTPVSQELKEVFHIP
eukprot:TRINITY_DN7993_c0_g1_i4.p1 TRINITY_DN7993_c0_g1~~TRINITY_DN7993_c0_g1_i4.p1  ORF type:complete len:213 (+),score=8.29 TRINITY_DN7993_c0_g1_i4:262-900(+)